MSGAGGEQFQPEDRHWCNAPLFRENGADTADGGSIRVKTIRGNKYLVQITHGPMTMRAILSVLDVLLLFNLAHLVDVADLKELLSLEKEEG